VGHDIRLIDEHGQEVPPGRIGEVVGRFDADGFLTLMDRCKDLIISGGLARRSDWPPSSWRPSCLEVRSAKY